MKKQTRNAFAVGQRRPASRRRRRRAPGPKLYEFEKLKLFAAHVHRRNIDINIKLLFA